MRCGYIIRPDHRTGRHRTAPQKNNYRDPDAAQPRRDPRRRAPRSRIRRRPGERARHADGKAQEPDHGSDEVWPTGCRPGEHYADSEADHRTEQRLDRVMASWGHHLTVMEASTMPLWLDGRTSHWGVRDSS
jgi:hypothetical protein